MRIHSILARLWGILVPPDDLDDPPAPAKARRVPVRDLDAADAEARGVTREA